MILSDVNVLLHAFRADSPDHERCRAWLEDLLNGPEAYGVSPQVLAAVVRISTHPKVYKQPSQTDEALRFCRAVIKQSHATLVTPGDRHWQIFGDLCQAAGARGNLVQDAWFAALAVEWGCEWVTLDRDYARFPGLRWRSPF